MLILPDAWTWDFWFADTGSEFHVFFLRASRALLDPERRHLRAGVGHAVSTDLRHWQLLPDALVHADPPAFDDRATWTGSVLAGPDGVWRMFYTGLMRSDPGIVQRIGCVSSTDLLTWHPEPGPATGGALIEADPRWYEPESWRDPWVFADPAGAGWQMLITARAGHGAANDRGVVGHARSDDLLHWQALPPLSSPDAGFGQLEVMQVEEVGSRFVLLFSCLAPQLSQGRREAGQFGGVWALTTSSKTGPFDLSRAHRLTGPELYSGRIIRDRDGQWVLLAFVNQDPAGEFAGGLSDPIPLAWGTGPDGEAVLRTGSAVSAAPTSAPTSAPSSS